jgi:ribosomal-protein-alanine N-acetyltransferase
VEVKIRPMTMSDVLNVQEIDLISFPNPWPLNSYAYEILKNENSRPWVIEKRDFDGTQICGMAVIWNIVDEAHLGTLAIHPDFRETGIGKIFLTSILLSAMDDGMRTGYLELRESNISAINMYKSIGYKIDGLRKAYYQDNHENAILMSIDLNSREYLENAYKLGLEKMKMKSRGSG